MPNLTRSFLRSASQVPSVTRFGFEARSLQLTGQPIHGVARMPVAWQTISRPRLVPRCLLYAFSMPRPCVLHVDMENTWTRHEASIRQAGGSRLSLHGEQTPNAVRFKAPDG